MFFSRFSDGHTIEKMRVVWKKGFDQSKVTDNNYISLTQFEYAVFFEENYEEEIASGKYLKYIPQNTGVLPICLLFKYSHSGGTEYCSRCFYIMFALV